MFSEARERFFNAAKNTLPRVSLIPLMVGGAMTLESIINTPVVEAGGGCEQGIALGLPQEPTGRVPCLDEYIRKQLTSEPNRPYVVTGAAGLSLLIIYLLRRRVSSDNNPDGLTFY